METLKIENFLTIRSAEIEVKDFTIFIGPQGSGKSVIAKLIYFFREFLEQQFSRSIRNFEDKRELQTTGLKKFEQLFPAYTWDKQEFFIEYKTGDVEIRLLRKEAANKKSALHLDYSENIAGLHRRIKSIYRKAIQESKQEQAKDFSAPKNEAFWEILYSYMYLSAYGYAFRPSVFIPASRSFFANLQQNVFSFLANNISIDPLIKEFGSIYEFGKTNYRRWGTQPEKRLFRRSEYWEKSFNELCGYIERIVAGKYIYEKDQDWIVSGNRRVNLANASSGQQESLPMLVVLLSRSLFSDKSRPTTFFIEEPEAHLFPVAQKDVVELLAKLGNLTGCRYVITTHSPYILTALNNLIYASNLSIANNNDNVDLDAAVGRIVPPQAQVSFGSVSAYVVENGEVASILDDEVNLIGASVIDQVSDQFDAVFSKLLELESEYV